MDRLARILIVAGGLAAVAWCGVGFAYRLLLVSLPVAVTDSGSVEAAAVVTPSSQGGEVDVAVILDRDMFRSAAPVAKAPKRPERRDIGLRLLGTVLGADPASSRAIILEERTRRQGLYQIGDRIAGAVVVNILARKVVLRLGERLVELQVDNAPAPSPVAPPPGPATSAAAGLSAGTEVISVSRHRVSNAIKMAGRILGSLKVTPYEENGVPQGLRISGLKVGSFLHQMGLRNRDVILEVNGEPLTGMEAAAQLFAKYRDSDEATVTVLRRGERKQIHYRIRR
ncbi:MAG TPA: hypothetical protein ENJ73_01170 [Desulfobacterales bacterium]|nr:hypothetical protein [Desulfobacterales bacterium]